jgi:hypothetical protein
MERRASRSSLRRNNGTMRISTTIALMMLTIAASPAARAQMAVNASPAPLSPAPASTGCWIYKNIYPVSRAAFESQHLTRAQQIEILKWARPVSPVQTKLVKAVSPWATPPSVSELGLVRWMRDGDDGSISIFVARPLFKAGESGHAPWLALNENVFIDPVNCDVGAYPTA